MKSQWSNESSNWITAIEAGEILDLSENTVSRWGTLGKLPTRIQDANVYFYRPAVLDWKQAKQSESKKEPDGIASLKRSEESTARSFRKDVQPVYGDVIYQTRPVSEGVEIVGFSRVGGDWKPVQTKVISRSPSRNQVSSKAGAK